TMCNEIALRVHARPGEEVIAHHTAHPINSETGGPAALAGVNVRAIDGPWGQFDATAVEAAVRPSSRYAPRTRLLWVEQTSNHGGGSVWSLARLEAVRAAARRHGLATHMDGARLMNAVVPRCATASSDWPRTTPTPGGSPRAWPACPASSSIPRPSRPTSCSSS